MKKISLRKPCPSPAKLLNLPEEQRDKLINWMMSGLAYDDIMKRVNEQLGQSIKTTGPLKRFWKKVCRPVLLQRQAEAKRAASTISTTIRKDIKKALENPEAKIEELKEVLRQIVAGEEKPASKLLEPAHSKEKAMDEANPLDDQEKLDEIRRQVFGSAPKS
jgi:hypothetical protein